jgi:hypothetical protein
MAPEGAEASRLQGHVTLVMNFFGELRRIAPATK